MVAMAAALPTPPRTPPMIAPIFIFFPLPVDAGDWPTSVTLELPFPWPRSVAVEVADADVENMAVASGSSGFAGKQLLGFSVACSMLT